MTARAEAALAGGGDGDGDDAMGGGAAGAWLVVPVPLPVLGYATDEAVAAATVSGRPWPGADGGGTAPTQAQFPLGVGGAAVGGWLPPIAEQGNPGGEPAEENCFALVVPASVVVASGGSDPKLPMLWGTPAARCGLLATMRQIWDQEQWPKLPDGDPSMKGVSVRWHASTADELFWNKGFISWLLDLAESHNVPQIIFCGYLERRAALGPHPPSGSWEPPPPPARPQVSATPPPALLDQAPGPVAGGIASIVQPSGGS